MRTIGFREGLLPLATNYAYIERVPLVNFGIIEVEFESLLELSLFSRKIRNLASRTERRFSCDAWEDGVSKPCSADDCESACYT